MFTYCIIILNFKFVSDNGVAKQNFDGDKLQESSRLSVNQYLPESNNTPDPDKVQSHILNNNFQNKESLLKTTEKENGEITVFNEKDASPLHMDLQQKNNVSVSEDLNPLNETNTENNYVHTAHSLIGIEESSIEDDLKTTQSLISLAMTITQDNINYKFVDDFEDLTTCFSKVSCSNKIETKNNVVEENGDQNIDPNKLEEEYKINNSLKLLESLVNIEHSKLEVQKNLTEELHKSNFESNEEKSSGISSHKSSRKKETGKSKKKLPKSSDGEEWTPEEQKKEKHHYFKHKNKSVKKDHKNKLLNKKHRKVKSGNNLANLFLNSSIEMQDDQNISLVVHDSKSSSIENTATVISTTTDNTLNTTKSEIIPLPSEKTPSDLPTDDLKTYSDNVENVLVNKKEIIQSIVLNDCDHSTSSIISASSCKDEEHLKNKSNILSSAMKSINCKKLYEMDRKSLFSPDIIISSKPIKDSLNDLIKENNQVKKTYNIISNEKLKVKRRKEKKNHPSSPKKTKSSHGILKVKISNNKTKITHPSQAVLNSISSSSNHKLTNSFTEKHKKFKKLKVLEPDDNDKNKNVSSIEILESKETNNKDTSKRQQLNLKQMTENEKSSTGYSEINSFPEWLKIKCATYNIKPLYVLIDPNIRY